jgi:hypothetical protein
MCLQIIGIRLNQKNNNCVLDILYKFCATNCQARLKLKNVDENNDEKEKIKSILSKNKQMIFLTTKSVQNINYIVVTCPYIDEG